MSIYHFTSGPLYVGTDDDMAIAVKTANNEVICRFTGDFSTTEDIANAQLYAAAPEMYDLLTRIILNRLGSRCMVGMDEIIAVLDKANGKEATP